MSRRYRLLTASLFGAGLLTAGLFAAQTPMFARAPARSPGSFTAPACDLASAGSTKAPPIKDMIAAPEGVPHGAIAPDGRPIGWAHKPRVWRGNNPQPGWTVVASTAMIYADRERPVSPGVRVEVRNIELFVQPRGGKGWCLLDRRVAPGGGLYAENFAGDNSVPMNARSGPQGGLSVRLPAGRNFHFWGNKVLIPKGGLAGVYVQYEARVIADAGTRRVDLVAAAYLGAASADYWKSMTAPSGQVGVLNEDAAIGRFVRLGTKWRVVSMNTIATPALAPAH